MARTLSSAILNVIAQGTSQVVHLLSFTVGQTPYRFAEDRLYHGGNLYLPHLVLDSSIRYSERLQVEPVTVRLQNITLETAAALEAEQSDLQGVEATLERLFLRAGETLILFIGQISEIQVAERQATLTLVGDLDPTAMQVPRRKYSSLCVWDFKDARCGYTDGVDPNDPDTGLPFLSCPKDFLSCQARGRQHRFPGFIHITRDLTLAVEGQLPDANEDERALGDWNAWE